MKTFCYYLPLKYYGKNGFPKMGPNHIDAIDEKEARYLIRQRHDLKTTRHCEVWASILTP